MILRMFLSFPMQENKHNEKHRLENSGIMRRSTQLKSALQAQMGGFQAILSL